MASTTGPESHATREKITAFTRSWWSTKSDDRIPLTHRHRLASQGFNDRIRRTYRIRLACRIHLPAIRLRFDVSNIRR
jgi:hypothetical protein